LLTENLTRALELTSDEKQNFLKLEDSDEIQHLAELREQLNQRDNLLNKTQEKLYQRENCEFV